MPYYDSMKGLSYAAPWCRAPAGFPTAARRKQSMGHTAALDDEMEKGVLKDRRRCVYCPVMRKWQRLSGLNLVEFKFARKHGETRGLVSNSSQVGNFSNPVIAPGATRVALDLHVPEQFTGMCDATRNVVEMISRRVAERPHATAIVDGSCALSYGELDQRSREIANRLGSLGVRRDVVVGIYAERSIGLVTAALGVMRAGGAYLPLDPGYPKERLAFQLADAQAEVVVTVEGASAGGAAILGKHALLCTADGRLAGQTASGPVSVQLEPGGLSYVIYT